MVNNYGMGYSVIRWEGSFCDVETLKTSSANYVCDDEGALLFFSMEDTVDGVISRTMLVEFGEHVIITPLGWMKYSEDAHELLRNVLGEL